MLESGVIKSKRTNRRTEVLKSLYLLFYLSAILYIHTLKEDKLDSKLSRFKTMLEIKWCN